MTTNTFGVTGMTCEHCVSALTAELRALPDVADVRVELVAGGVSTVTVISSKPLTEQAIVGALDEAGDYHLAD